MKRAVVEASDVNDENVVDPVANKKKREAFSAHDFTTRLKEGNIVSVLEDFIENARDNSSDIVTEYLKMSPECNEVFKLMDGEKRPPSQMQLILELLECILLHISDNTSYKSTAMSIVQRLLENYKRQLNDPLGIGRSAKYTKSCLRLLTAMVMVDANTARDVQNHFDLHRESFISLLHRRDSRAQFDVRVWFIRLCISFLINGDDQVIQKMIDFKGLFNTMFKNISKDKASTIHLILSTMKRKIVCNPVISKTSKMRLFSENSLQSLSTLYKWKGHYDMNLEQTEGQVNSQLEGLNIIREEIHDFLQTLTCSLRFGINFFDRSLGTSGRIQNNILLRFLLSLRSAVNDILVQDLVIRILKVCPDIINKYLTGCDYTFNPRQSIKWSANMNLLMKIYESQPEISPALKMADKVPLFKLVAMVMVTTVPVVATRPMILQGIRTDDSSVQNTILDFLIMILKKVKFIVKYTENCENWIQNSVYSQSDMKHFSGLYKEAVTKVIPEISSILACWNKLSKKQSQTDKNGDDQDVDDVVMETEVIDSSLEVGEQSHSTSAENDEQKLKTDEYGTMIKSKILRILCLYQEILPDSFYRCSHDFSRLLNGITTAPSTVQFYVLQLLLDSPAGKYRWFKEVKGQGTSISHLLHLFVTTQDAQVLKIVNNLVRKLLLETGIFDQNVAEIQLWLSNIKQHCHGNNTDDIIATFEKLLTKVVRNPYPFTDKVVDIVYESKTIENEKTEVTTTIGDKAIQDILSMGDISMETTDVLTPTSDSEMNIPNVWPSEFFPFSPLVVAVLQEWNSSSLKDAVEDCLLDNIKDVLHYQLKPETICLLVQQTFTPTENITSNYQRELLHYCDKFTGKNQHIKKTPKKKKHVFGKNFQDILYQSFLRNPESILEDNTQMQLSKSITELDSSQLENSVRNVLLYLKSALKNIEMVQVKDVVVAYVSILQHLIQHSVTMETLQFDKEPAKERNQSEEENDANLNFMEIILTHPIIFEWFLPSSDSKTTLKIGKVLTEFICSLLVKVNHVVMTTEFESLYKMYMKKFFNFIFEKTTKLKKKFAKDSEKATLGSQMKTCIQMMFSLNLTMVSNDDLQKIMTEFLTLPLQVLIDDEKKTTVCGKALLQIMESQVPSKETFQQLVQMMQLAGCHDIDVILLRLLKDNLTYVVYTTMETLQYCLDNPSKIRIEISKVLVTHNIAHQLQFEEWCQRKRNLKLLSNNKSVYLPVISVYLKKFKLVANGVQSKNALESLRCALLPWLHTWLLEGRDNEVEESLQFSVWCELITGYQDIGNKYKQLICKVTEHSQTWNRYQAEGCLRMMQILHTDENDEYKMSYTKSSLQCLNLLHKDALQIQLEHFLNRSVISVAMTLSSLPSTTGFTPVWNRYVKTGLKNRYENSDFLRCLSRLLPKVYGSITIEGAVHLSTIYQMVISHSRFLATMMSKEDTNDKQTNKELLVVLLLTMAKLKPVDCCNTSHFTVLLAAYGCTLSKIDQLILQLMNIYEANNAVMWQYRPYMWGASAMEQHRKQHQFGSSLRNVLGMKDILQLLDKDKMQQTVLKFPLKRRLQLSLQDSITTDNPSIYDPCFLLPLFSHLMTPASVVGVRLFVEFHGLGLVISALSSVDSNMRAAAYLVLTDFCQHLEGAIFKEKKQFLYLMECLKNSVTEPNMRISNIITTFIGKVLQILFVPEDTMYPMVQRFLLMKPELNLQTVPQFQRLFASSDFEFKRQHEWILKICQDGLRDQLDFYICNKKCFVFKQIMSLFSSATCDKVTKIQILDIIKSAGTIRGGAVELGRYHGLLPWLHSIIISSDNDVLESVVNTVNTMWMTLSAPKLQYTKSDVDNKPQSLVSMRTIIGVFIICDAVLNKLELKIPASFLKLILQLIESVTTYQHTTYGKTSSSDRILSVMRKYGQTFHDVVVLANLSFKRSNDTVVAAATPQRRNTDVEVDDDIKFECLRLLLSILRNTQVQDMDCETLLFVLVWSLRKVLDSTDVSIECIHNHVLWVCNSVIDNKSIGYSVVTSRGWLDSVTGIGESVITDKIDGSHLLNLLLSIYPVVHQMFVNSELGLIQDGGTTELSDVKQTQTHNVEFYINTLRQLNKIFQSFTKISILCCTDDSERAHKISVLDSAVNAASESELNTEMQAVCWQEFLFGKNEPDHFRKTKQKLEMTTVKTKKKSKKRKST